MSGEEPNGIGSPLIADHTGVSINNGDGLGGRRNAPSGSLSNASPRCEEDEYSATSHQRKVVVDSEDEDGGQEFTADIAVLQGLADTYNLDVDQVKQMLMQTSMTTKENYNAGRSTTTTLNSKEVRTVAIEGAGSSRRHFGGGDDDEEEEMTDTALGARIRNAEGGGGGSRNRSLSVLRLVDSSTNNMDDDVSTVTTSMHSLQSDASECFDDDGQVSPRTRRRRKEKKASNGKKVGFADAPDMGSSGGKSSSIKKNLVKNVVVYEVDNQIFIDIKFQRNRIGWIFIVLGLFFDIVNPCLALYFDLVFQSPGDKLPASVYALNFWGSVWAIFYCSIVTAIFFATKLISARDFRWLKRYDALLLSNAWGLLWAAFQFMQVWMADFEYIELKFTPQYVPTISLFMVFFLVWRKIKGETIFFAEWLSLGCAWVGYIIVSIPHLETFFPDYWRIGISLNLFLLLAAVLITVWFFATEYLIKRGVTKMAILIPALFQMFLVFMVGGIIKTTYHSDARVRNSVFWPMFDSRWVGWGALNGFTILGAPMFYLFSAAYLDVASLVSCIAVKTCLMPWALHFLVYQHLTAETEAIFKAAGITADRGWSVFLWVGTPLVLIGCIIIVVFASVKRQFAARRFALSPANLKKTKNPYAGAKKMKNLKKQGTNLGDIIDVDDGGMSKRYQPVGPPKKEEPASVPPTPRREEPPTPRREEPPTPRGEEPPTPRREGPERGILETPRGAEEEPETPRTRGDEDVPATPREGSTSPRTKKPKAKRVRPKLGEY